MNKAPLDAVPSGQPAEPAPWLIRASLWCAGLAGAWSLVYLIGHGEDCYIVCLGVLYIPVVLVFIGGPFLLAALAAHRAEQAWRAGRLVPGRLMAGLAVGLLLLGMFETASVPAGPVLALVGACAGVAAQLMGTVRPPDASRSQVGVLVIAVAAFAAGVWLFLQGATDPPPDWHPAFEIAVIVAAAAALLAALLGWPSRLERRLRALAVGASGLGLVAAALTLVAQLTFKP